MKENIVVRYPAGNDLISLSWPTYRKERYAIDVFRFEGESNVGIYLGTFILDEHVPTMPTILHVMTAMVEGGLSWMDEPNTVGKFFPTRKAGK